jgi:hypothetical protein
MRERENKTHAEIKGKVDSQRRRLKLAPSSSRHVADSIAIVPCVTSGIEKEGNSQRHI